MMNFAKITKKSASNEHQNSEKQFNNVDMSVPGVTTGGKRQREQDIDNVQRTREDPVDDASACTAISIKRQKEINDSKASETADEVLYKNPLPAMHIQFKKPPVVHSPRQLENCGRVYADAVCVSPRSGTLFITPVLIDTEHSCDSDVLTSENNPGIRSEAAKMFNSYGKEG